MLQISFVKDAWQMQEAGVSETKLRNLCIIDNPIAPEGWSYTTRPSLGLHDTVGTGPSKGFWRQEGAFGGDAFVVSGIELYRYSVENKAATLIGSIPGFSVCEFAGVTDRVLIARDGLVYMYDGTDFTTLTIPDDLYISSIDSINGYFLLSVKDSDRFYWIEPGETEIEALSFATAERKPDPITAIRVISDEIWLLGKSGPEVWAPTGDATAPFQRINGRVYSDGCLSAATAVCVVSDNLPALIWVSDTYSVILAQGTTAKISNISIENKLRDASNFRAWFFKNRVNSFYVLTTDQQTFVYDLKQNNWSTWDSYGLTNWRAHLGVQVGGNVYAGDSETGAIWIIEDEGRDEGEFIICEISGGVFNVSEPTLCSVVTLRINSGWSQSYVSDPVIETRWSDDQGATWSIYMGDTLGLSGEYSQEVDFRSLGLIRRPGRLFEFRFSGPHKLRLDYATINAR